MKPVTKNYISNIIYIIIFTIIGVRCGLAQNIIGAVLVIQILAALLVINSAEELIYLKNQRIKLYQEQIQILSKKEK